ncbi:TerB family tellurite resistance protein [Sulfitobacter sabulilitoris]|uniref:TerB family tellurite resistance protein n=1 Tax=Sulfitobacter sabulilitoris TaxID=2562655 RepID=A0A5S3PB61_9RHOB|nr:TerB family tellurite resistance protein [Sulfitobacter sabulilitoris]TMM50841.1 TerB family tellurite resistance protein [Sulfitobacter sabulilitoris]
MFERLFPRRKPDPKPLPQPNAQLALGALLVRVAMADRDYNATEVGQIDRILAATFGLKPLEAAKLRATCEKLEMHAPGTPEFAAILRDEVPYADRKALADAMWAVALADGDRAEREEITLMAIETELGLTDEDIVTARRTALRQS